MLHYSFRSFDLKYGKYVSMGSNIFLKQLVRINGQSKKRKNGGFMWHGDPNIGVVMIITVIFCSLSAVPILVGLLIFNNAKKKREAELMKLSVEKGLPIPIFPERHSLYGTLKAGMIWIAVGIGIILMVIIEGEGRMEGVSFGFLPILIGVALIISWKLESREANQAESK
jgi:hypothetical protein